MLNPHPSTGHSDLALEFAKPLLSQPPEGLSAKTYRRGSVEITCITISSEEVSHRLSRPCGRYITLETPPLWNSFLDPQEEIEAAADCIRHLLPEKGTVLVVGLGNRSITADALGPVAAEHILTTRHLPENIIKSLKLDSLRKTAAIVPGTTGQTGIESREIICSLIKSICPSAAVILDALAAQDYAHLGKTIQISDSGIIPGSGVKNSRFPLSPDTLGIPIISLGVPTVIDAAVFMEKSEAPSHPAAGAIVTPREVDKMIEHSAKFIALAVNKSLHPQLSLEEIAFLCS